MLVVCPSSLSPPSPSAPVSSKKSREIFNSFSSVQLLAVKTGTHLPDTHMQSNKAKEMNLRITFSRSTQVAQRYFIKGHVESREVKYGEIITK